jgi:hypothetical protein
LDNLIGEHYFLGQWLAESPSAQESGQGGAMPADIKESFKEVLWAIAPLSLVMSLLQISIIHLPLVDFARFLVGAVLVLAGLLLFLQGVKVGLPPMGEMIGAALPKRATLTLFLPAAFPLGFLVTVTEPDVRVLAHQGDMVSEGKVAGICHLLAEGWSCGTA